MVDIVSCINLFLHNCASKHRKKLRNILAPGQNFYLALLRPLVIVRNNSKFQKWSHLPNSVLIAYSRHSFVWLVPVKRRRVHWTRDFYLHFCWNWRKTGVRLWLFVRLVVPDIFVVEKAPRLVIAFHVFDELAQARLLKKLTVKSADVDLPDLPSLYPRSRAYRRQSFLLCRYSGVCARILARCCRESDILDSR